MNIMKTIDTSSIKKDWQTRGYSADIWTDPPGQVWQDYIHGADELLMLIDGEIEVHLGGEILRPGVGEEIFIPAHEPHTVINIGTTTNHWLYGYKRHLSN